MNTRKIPLLLTAIVIASALLLGCGRKESAGLEKYSGYYKCSSTGDSTYLEIREEREEYTFMLFMEWLTEITGIVVPDNDGEALLTGTDAADGMIRFELDLEDSGEYELEAIDSQWDLLPNGTYFTFQKAE